MMVIVSLECDLAAKSVLVLPDYVGLTDLGDQNDLVRYRCHLVWRFLLQILIVLVPWLSELVCPSVGCHSREC
jgi:hypothetical protein